MLDPVEAHHPVKFRARPHRHQHNRADALHLEQLARRVFRGERAHVGYLERPPFEQRVEHAAVERHRQALQMFDHRLGAGAAPFVRVVADLAVADEDVGAVALAIGADARDGVVDRVVDFVDRGAQQVVENVDDQRLNPRQARLVGDRLAVHAGHFRTCRIPVLAGRPAPIPSSDRSTRYHATVLAKS